MKKLENIIVHCSDSEWGSAREITKWHLVRGFRTIGYHFVILNSNILSNFSLSCLDGSIELGRELDGDSLVEENEIGAHTLGYNDKSIGICGIAKKGWTHSQELSLIQLLKCLCKKFQIPPEKVLGHCETESGRKEGKTCPNLDMNKIRGWLVESK